MQADVLKCILWGMSFIKNIVVAGGTHGNEMTGVRLLDKWMRSPSDCAALCPSAQLSFVIGNPEAVRLNRRYRDFDLNRTFSQTCLDSLAEPMQYEFRRAKELN